MAEARDKPPLVSLSEHPRAGRSIRTAKGWGGLVGFTVAGAASHAAGAGFDGTALRALTGGIAGYLVAWWLAIVVWRNLLQAEARVAIERALAKRKELAARAAEAPAQGEAVEQ